MKREVAGYLREHQSVRWFSIMRPYSHSDDVASNLVTEGEVADLYMI